MYAIIENNAVLEYPIVNLRTRFPSISFPTALEERHLPDGVVRVHNAPFPQYSANTHKCVPKPLPELVNAQWQTAFDVVPLSPQELQNLQAARREDAKRRRQEAVESIIVTTSSGKQFNGDEVSQGRMSRAIMGMQAANTPSIIWVLANNVPTAVTVAELMEALVLSGQEQGRVWTLE